MSIPQVPACESVAHFGGRGTAVAHFTVQAIKIAAGTGTVTGTRRNRNGHPRCDLEKTSATDGHIEWLARTNDGALTLT